MKFMSLFHPGWTRLVIALSIAWLVFVSAYLIYEWNEPFYKKHVFFTHYPDPSGIHKGTDDDPIPVFTPFKVISFLQITFVPISLFWIVALVIVPTTRWILDGFRGSQTKA